MIQGLTNARPMPRLRFSLRVIAVPFFDAFIPHRVPAPRDTIEPPLYARLHFVEGILWGGHQRNDLIGRHGHFIIVLTPDCQARHVPRVRALRHFDERLDVRIGVVPDETIADFHEWTELALAE